MARKKKTESVEVVESWPKVVVGNHLTVTTYENGRTELAWDDEALARDVAEAIKGYELSLVKVTEEKVKKTRKTKKESN